MYHQEAIILLSKGWNPVQKNIPAEIKANLSGYAINHYPKAIWISCSSIVSVFKFIEYGKAVNFLILISTFLLTIYLLSQVLAQQKKRYILSFSFLLVFNPVVISQLLTFYVDANVYLFILLFLSLTILICINRENNLYYIFYILVGIILINIKFTSFLYGFFFIFCLNLYLILKKNKAFKKVFICSIIITIFGIGVVGYGTFVKNIIYHNNPFYPVVGKEQKNVIGNQLPEIFLTKNRFEKIFYSLFSKSEDISVTDKRLPILKLPLTLQIKEITNFAKGGGIRIGGFGPLFGGIFILAVLLSLIYIKRIYSPPLVILFIVILFSGFLNPEAWWARLSPQFWILPFVIIIPMVGVIQRKLLYVILFLIVGNVTLVLIPMAGWQVANTLSMVKQYKILKKIPQPLLVDFSPFWASNKERIKYFGLKYKEVDNSNCVFSVSCLRSDAKICLDKCTLIEKEKLLSLEKKDFKTLLIEEFW